MRFVRALVAALFLGTSLAAGPAAAPAPVRGIGTLPACEIRDVLAAPRGYDDWATTLVDWTFTVGPEYKPPDLVSVRKGGVSGGGLVRKVVIDDLNALAAAAKKNGTPLVAWSPYRSYSTQEKLFNGGVKGYGYDTAITAWGRPGHSEHQLGTTVDFVAVGDSGLTSNWEVTRTGGWMAKHAWEFGWLMSYPKGKQDLVCYHYEPWHYRYYGRDLAKKIHDSGLTPREYLWANFTQFDSSLKPIATATAAPPPPTAAPSTGPDPGLTGGVPTVTTAPGAAASPAPTALPAAPASSLLGIDPAVLIAGGLLIAASIALVYSIRRARRRAF